MFFRTKWDLLEYLGKDRKDVRYIDRLMVKDIVEKVAWGYELHDPDKEEIERLKKYTYFTYPDYDSKEYESYIMNLYLSYTGPFSSYHIETALKEAGEELDEVIILMEIS